MVMQNFIELVEGYNDKRLWVNIHTGEIVEAERFHNLTIYKSPERFGMDAANPILRKYDGREEDYRWTQDLANDEEIKFVAFLNGWVRVLYSHYRGGSMDVEAANDQTARAALDQVLGHRYSAQTINLDIGTTEVKSFRLKDLNEIEAYINKGRKPRGYLPEEFWDASALFHYLREGDFDPGLCWPLVCEWTVSNGFLDSISEVLDDNIDTTAMLMGCDPTVFYVLQESDQIHCANWCLDFLLQHNPDASRLIVAEEKVDLPQDSKEDIGPRILTESAGEMLNERTTRATSGKGEPFTIVENPSSGQIENLLRAAPNGIIKGLLSSDGKRLMIWPAYHATHHVAFGFYLGLSWDEMMHGYLEDDRDIEADMLADWTPVWIDQHGIEAARDVGHAQAIRRAMGEDVRVKHREYA
jgi:hypothetical protein